MATNALRIPTSNSVFQPPLRVVEFPTTGRTRAVVQGAAGDWVDSVTGRLNELCALPVGWDGYQGLPVTWDNANFAFQMLSAICRPTTPPPQIVPGPSGDLQLEWHLPGQSIELNVLGPLRVRAWRSAAGIEEEKDLTDDFIDVVRWIAEPAVAAVAAAH